MKTHCPYCGEEIEIEVELNATDPYREDILQKVMYFAATGKQPETGSRAGVVEKLEDGSYEFRGITAGHLNAQYSTCAVFGRAKPPKHVSSRWEVRITSRFRDDEVWN